jgi:hypothetical protein
MKRAILIGLVALIGVLVVWFWQRDNGAMWVQVAALRLSTDDEEGAIDALRHAISAPIFDNYYDEQISLVERGLAVGSNLSFSERAFFALGTASVTPIALNSLTARCKSGVAGVWPELCDQLGFRPKRSFRYPSPARRPTQDYEAQLPPYQ